MTTIMTRTDASRYFDGDKEITMTQGIKKGNVIRRTPDKMRMNYSRGERIVASVENQFDLSYLELSVTADDEGAVFILSDSSPFDIEKRAHCSSEFINDGLVKDVAKRIAKLFNLKLKKYTIG